MKPAAHTQEDQTRPFYFRAKHFNETFNAAGDVCLAVFEKTTAIKETSSKVASLMKPNTDKQNRDADVANNPQPTVDKLDNINVKNDQLSIDNL